MTTIRCRRCGREGAALERPPLPGEAGRLVAAGTCSDCWEEWKREQVKLINEEQLSPVDPAHYDRLISRMLRWLALDEA